MKTPILETERMILRPVRMEDAEDIYERWTSDDRVSKYVRWSTHKSVLDTKEWLKEEVAGIDGDKSYQWGFTLKDTGYLFGSGGIFINKDKNVYELGYNIMHDFWGQGYTTEAVKEIINFAFKELGITELVACHAVDNPASGAVMMKCGFVYEGEHEIHQKFDGSETYDTKVYKLKLSSSRPRTISGKR